MAKFVDDFQLFRHSQHVDDLVGAGQQEHISLASRQCPHVCFQRFHLLGKFPSVNSDWLHRGPACFQASDQRCIGDPVFLQANGLVGDGDVGVDRLQQFSPSVWFGDPERRFNADFTHRRGRFWTTANRDDIG